MSNLRTGPSRAEEIAARARMRALRRLRARRLRRRVAATLCTSVLVVVLWSLLARYAPPGIAPPRPENVGAVAAREAVRRTAAAADAMYATARPGLREERKRAALATVFRHVTWTVPDAANARAEEDTAHTARSAGTTTRMIDTSVVPRPLAVFRRTVPGIVRLREKEPLPDPQPQWDARDLIAARAAPIDTGEPTIETTKHGRPTEEVNILVIGVDSRLGREQARADALQLLTIERDPVRVRITSIPRGTPCPLGYANPGSNIISHARSARGRDGLLVRVARLCGKPAIPYFVEFGFSQALGALELLGIGDPVATLHALRRRKGYQFGDRERSFLQGEFIRLHIGDALAKAEGLSGEILLAAALRFVETNLTKDQCLGLAYALRDAGVGRDPERIEHRMIGTYAGRIERNAAAIAARAEGTNHTRGETAGMAASRAEGVIRRALAQAERHTDAPRRVVSDLRRIYEQRGWLQVSDRAARFALRDSLAGVLLRAADAIGDRRLSAVVAHGREADIKLFGN